VNFEENRPKTEKESHEKLRKGCSAFHCFIQKDNENITFKPLKNKTSKI